jgi:hypothetical protein
MRPWTLSLLLSAAALCWQLNAKADDDREQWQPRHHRSYDEARRGDRNHDEDQGDAREHRYDEDRRGYRDRNRDQRDERDRRYEEGQNSEGREAHRHHRHKAIHVGPVTIER